MMLKLEPLNLFHFAGVSYRSKICALGVDQNEARFDEVFEWSMGRPIDAHETLDIHLINKSKYNIAGANRLAQL